MNLDLPKLVPLFRKHHVELLLAHGSQVDGRIRPDSDLDLAICVRGPALSFQIFGEIWDELSEAVLAEGSEATGVDVDLGMIHTGSETLYAHEVFKHGRVLWGVNDQAYGWWASLIMRRYDDTRWLRQIEQKEVERRFGA